MGKKKKRKRNKTHTKKKQYKVRRASSDDIDNVAKKVFGGIYYCPGSISEKGSETISP